MERIFPLSPSEIENYSVTRAISDPTHLDETLRKQWEKHQGYTFGIGTSVHPSLFFQRDLSVGGGATAGANLVGQTLSITGFAQLSALEKTGPEFLTGLKGDAAITILTPGSGTLDRTTEAGTAGALGLTTTGRVMKPQRIGNYETISARIWTQAAIRPQLDQRLAEDGMHELTDAVVNGSGTGEILGLLNDTSIGTLSLPGAAWQDVNDAVKVLTARHYTSDSILWFMSPTDASKFRVRPRNDGDLCLIENGMMAGCRVIECPEMPAGSCIVGCFRELVVAIWSTELLVDDVTQRKDNLVLVHYFLFADSAPRNPAAFLRCSDLS